ncbi:hypothetical protein MANES_02G221260v8 [Manihot esculenta]|uniref:Uncharacterized protein n=1 Tax=Manihot esculenta TaxID=3983 RepID=A0ACB7I7I6_MANES|nr:hypothetical protein MANES_02G221260v8 [Manihot esculenta]
MSGVSGSMESKNGGYMNVNCFCGKRVGVRISKSASNLNKLYFYCRDNKCGSFLGWCITTNVNSPTSNSIGDGLEVFKANLSRTIAKTKEEFMKMNEETKKLHVKLQKVKIILNQMKNCMIIMLLLLIVIVVKAL